MTMFFNSIAVARRAAGGIPWRRLLLVLALLGGAVYAQEPGTPLPAPDLLQALRDGSAKNQLLSEGDRAAAAAAYDEAARLAQQALDLKKSTTDLEAKRDGAAETEKQLRTEIEKQRTAPPIEIKKGATLADVEPLLTAADGDYKAAQAEFEAALADPDQRAARRREIPGLQETARQRERESLDALNAPAPAGEAAELTSARRVAAQARLEAARAELKLMETELASFDVLNGLVSVRQEVAKARLSKNEGDLKVLQEAAAGLRREEASVAARKAEEDLLKIPDCDPVVREKAIQLAKENATLAYERLGDDGLAKNIEDATNEAAEQNARLAALREQWNNVKQRVSAGGFSETVGVLLRKQRAELPSPRRLEVNVRQREALAASIELKQGDKRQQRLALADVGNALETAMTTSMAGLSQYEKQRIQGVLRKLVDDQRGLIDAVTSDYTRYLTQLEEINRTQRELAQVSREFGDYISENVLWIRGRPPVSWHAIGDTRDAALWLFDMSAWERVPPRLAQEVKAYPLTSALQAVGVLLLVGLRRSLRQRLLAIGANARSRRDTEFEHTATALVYSVLVSIAWPGLLWFAAVRLGAVGTGADQVGAVAAGALSGAWLWWSLEFVRVLLVPDGLADAHFDWSVARESKGLRRLLAAVTVISVPAVALNAALNNYAEDSYIRSLGVLAYLVTLLAAGLAATRAAKLCYRAIREDDPEYWFVADTYRGLLARWAVPLAQAALGLMALAGYYYTSVEIAARAYQSGVILVCALAASSAVRRWLLLARRRLAIEQARRKREALRAEAEADKGDVPVARDDRELDIMKVDAQSQAAIRIVTVLCVLMSLWVVWVDVVPALNALQGIPLWNTVGTVEVQNVAADGTVQRSMQERVQTITAANLGLSLAALVIMVLAVRNLPGLIEIAILQRLKMAAGERYATLAVVRYAVTGLGVVLAFQAIGVGWSKVQWLIAALGVGLGFGMQEIFANFISGLILLFERPIRVGDIVTVGGTSGTVSQIRIRATTITDFDNKDFIVPNKEFVTGHLLNWCLSSPSVRVVVPVVIGYGSNVDAALRIVLEAAMKHPKVLHSPEPQAIFTGFGEKFLNLELRCFSPDVGSMAAIRHELFLRIIHDFAAAGIEHMAVPRDPAAKIDVSPAPGSGA